MTTYPGPTVAEYAESRLRQIEKEIRELVNERATLKLRLAKYAGSMMLESERRATQSEVFQTKQLPT